MYALKRLSARAEQWRPEVAMLGVLIPIVCSACAPIRQRQVIPEPACDVVLHYVKNFKASAGTPVALWLAPSPDETRVLQEDVIDQGLKRIPQSKNDPWIAVFRSLARVRNYSVVKECPNLLQWWNENSVIRDDLIISKTMRSMPFLNNPARKNINVGFIAVSAPVIYQNGNYVSFQTSETTRISGGPFLVTYRRTEDGRWKMVRKDLLAIG
ncbi:hypothetical protein [Novosphingobium sp.]|uniref:hypothetical protein n=1 Tax=Novosphingobium sp. TaxID=1874826 RepID=UPI002639D5BD|nr:hypothetical protein [Novosphingobium sp.]